MQAMNDVSPPKWHLAHTTWFFDTFLLKTFSSDYECFDETFEYLFNSYYETVGSFHPRQKRGLLTRPNISKVLEYRRFVDEKVMACLSGNLQNNSEFQRILEIGIHHEQQHQELLYMDIKFNLFSTPQKPRYISTDLQRSSETMNKNWQKIQEGIYTIGAEPGSFHYDNEGCRHKVYVEAAAISDRLSTNGEYLAFLNSGAYQEAKIWLSDGWHYINKQNIKHPLYWQHDGEQWLEFTLHGLLPLDLNAPVSHLSFFEADAFARWSEARLPTEFEWEALATADQESGIFLESGKLHPYSDRDKTSLLGNLWQWTSSSYGPYPRFKSESGALGEYNGKFMCNQYVLRGGSFATEQSHIRHSYRNFFPSHSQWMFSGIRLAKDLT